MVFLYGDIKMRSEILNAIDVKREDFGELEELEVMEVFPIQRLHLELKKNFKSWRERKQFFY